MHPTGTMRIKNDDESNHALPFASCYAQPVSSSHHHAPAAAASTGVCIVRQNTTHAAPQLECSILQQAGFKTRVSSSCVPDLIITLPTLPAPLAVMLITSTDPADSLDNPGFIDRCCSMVRIFRTCAVALPHVLGSHAAVLQLACDAKFKGKILLHYMCPGDNPAHTIMQLISCCSNSPEALQLAADAWNEVVAAATTPAALEACMTALRPDSQPA